MSTALKCPNPSCPYLFDPSRVPAGVALTCPRCGMRFTLGPPSPSPAAGPPSGTTVPGYDPSGLAPPQPTGYTGYASAAPPGYAPPPPQPPADPAFAGMSPDAAEPAADGRPQRRSFSAAGEPGMMQTIVVVFIGLALMAGVGATIYFQVVHKPTRIGGTAAQLRDFNLTFDPPAAPWAADDDNRAKLGPPIILAYKRTEPEAYIAFGMRDYVDRNPRINELRDGLNRPLSNLFEDIRPSELAGATWLGQQTPVAYEFRARLKDGANVLGQCHALFHKGIGYWSICWVSENEAKDMTSEFEAMRARFKLGSWRESWDAKRAPERTFGGHAIPYQLIDGEDLWKEPDVKDHPPSDLDPKADLLLVTKKQKGEDFGEKGMVLAMVLDQGGDPLAEGRRYVEDQETDRISASGLTPMFSERKGEVEGDPVDTTVAATSPVVRLQMTVPKASSASRLIVVSAIRVGNKIVVVKAWCAWNDRTVYESRLVQIAGSLRDTK